MNPFLIAATLAVHPAHGEKMTSLTQPPEVSPAKTFEPSTPAVFALANGITVWLMHRPDLPLVSLSLAINGGSGQEPAESPGLSAFTDSMILKGAGERDAIEFAKTMEQHAIELDVGTGVNGTRVVLSAHTDSFSLGLDLLADAVRRPHLDKEDLEREREIQTGQLTEALDDARTVGAWVFNRVYFGADHPFGRPVRGTLGSVSRFTAEQLKQSWQDRFGRDQAHFIVAGDVDQATLLAALEARFGDWGEAASPPSKITVAKRAASGPRLVFVDKPGTSQTSLRVGMPAPTYGSPLDEYADLGSVVLGGTFTSRLNHLLREEKGYTYGARARVSATPEYGMLLATTNVQQEVSAPALVDLLAEIKRYRDGITEAELNKARSAEQTQVIEAMASRGGIVGVLSGHALNNRPADTLATSLKKSQAATVANVDEAIKTSSIEQGLIVVVGDLAEIRASIEEAVPGDWTELSPAM